MPFSARNLDGITDQWETLGISETVHPNREISLGGDEMQIEKYFHKCGYPILEVKKPMGLVVDTFFLDGNTPFLQAKDGKQNPNVIKRCPECGGFIALEKTAV